MRFYQSKDKQIGFETFRIADDSHRKSWTALFARTPSAVAMHPLAADRLRPVEDEVRAVKLKKVV